MLISFSINTQAHWGYFSEFIRVLYYGSEVINGEDNDATAQLTINIDSTIDNDGGMHIAASGVFYDRQLSQSYDYPSNFFKFYHSEELEGNHLKAIKRSIIVLLRDLTERKLPWGTLTGVRPGKVVHKFLEKGFDPDFIKKTLVTHYAMDREKAILLSDMAIREKAFFPDPGKIALYVGIPFCPSRCLYCSFTSYPDDERKRNTYFQSLLKEIKDFGETLKANSSSEVDNIYIGGGTPSVLTAKQIDELFSLLHNSFNCTSSAEVSFEAGRPDSITYDKLLACQNNGVNRISVNPQTIHASTLHKIGRKHDFNDVQRAVAMVRQVGFSVLNMDMIIGLPGEDEVHVESTIHELLLLNPGNITVHSLAIKRASELALFGLTDMLPEINTGVKMQTICEDSLAAAGMYPYYLYRQKHMLDDLENVGYCLKDCECVYNIRMIEDWQTIIGLGAGGKSKFLMSDGKMLRYDNPKDPLMYQSRIMELPAKENETFQAWLMDRK